MANDNPHESSIAPPQDTARMVRTFYWRTRVFLLGAVIASVPFYGYRVDGVRDSQETALLIVVCWLLNVIFLIGSIVFAVVRPPDSDSIRITAMSLTAYLAIAVVVGWGGVGHAIIELIANP